MTEHPVAIDYTNHRGERSIRVIQPRRIIWANSEWHPRTQWLLEAFDYGKKADREFAMENIHSWKNANVAGGEETT